MACATRCGVISLAVAVPASASACVAMSAAMVRSALRLPPPVRPVPVAICREASALALSAVCVAVLTGLLASDVLSTLPRPTSSFASVTAPVLPATENTGPSSMIVNVPFPLSRFM